MTSFLIKSWFRPKFGLLKHQNIRKCSQNNKTNLKIGTPIELNTKMLQLKCIFLHKKIQFYFEMLFWFSLSSLFHHAKLAEVFF